MRNKCSYISGLFRVGEIPVCLKVNLNGIAEISPPCDWRTFYPRERTIAEFFHAPIDNNEIPNSLHQPNFFTIHR